VDALGLVLHNDCMLLAHKLAALQLQWRAVLQHELQHELPKHGLASCSTSAQESSPGSVAQEASSATACSLADLAYHARAQVHLCTDVPKPTNILYRRTYCDTST
jgi:hypothetical protein